MCSSDAPPVAAALPRTIGGVAVDPIALDPVDQIEITTLVDNSYDGLLTDTGPAHRAPPARLPSVAAAHFEQGRTVAGLVAEHGFSALVMVRTGDRKHTLLFDTGVSPNGMADNMRCLGLDAADVEALVLSHGHWDHVGGVSGLAGLRRRAGLPLTVHPLVWTQRRVTAPGREWELPTLSRRAMSAEGFEVIERRQPSLLLDGCVLITGEIDRTTDFETGLPMHEARRGDGDWEPDPLILDDQALVVHLRGRGLVVLTGCGHAGAVNICRYAMRLTGVTQVAALLGGLHLSGPAFEPVIEPSVNALRELAPQVVVPAHCTGWRAQHRLAATLGEAFVPSAVGTRFDLAS